MAQELNEMKIKLETLKNVNSELLQTKSVLSQKDAEIDNLISLLQSERNEKEQIIVAKNKEIDSYQIQCKELEIIRANLMREIDKMKESVSEEKLDVEGIKNIVIIL